jgi:hypothetical protein
MTAPPLKGVSLDLKHRGGTVNCPLDVFGKHRTKKHNMLFAQSAAVAFGSEIYEAIKLSRNATENLWKRKYVTRLCFL